MIAIAAGSTVYYYLNFQPHMKFEVPMTTFSAEEKDVW